METIAIQKCKGEEEEGWIDDCTLQNNSDSNQDGPKRTGISGFVQATRKNKVHLVLYSILVLLVLVLFTLLVIYMTFWSSSSITQVRRHCGNETGKGIGILDVQCQFRKKLIKFQ